MPTQKASQRDFRLVKPFVIFLLLSFLENGIGSHLKINDRRSC